jgi:mannitol/fructose-specific phosphotransferase system IIA component (Ntr-type)
MSHQTIVSPDPGDPILVLDVDAHRLDKALDIAVEVLQSQGRIRDEAVEAAVNHAIDHHADLGPDAITHGVAIVHAQLPVDGVDMQVVLRLVDPLLTESGDGGEHLHWVWILLTSEETHPQMSRAAGFADFMADAPFRKQMAEVDTWADFARALREAYDQDIHFERHVPDELRPTGRLAGGIINDIRRRAPHYASDFTDGLNAKSIASVFFLFFACLAPAVAFGGLLSVLTEGTIGAMEMIVATTLCGTVYALTSGQPLTILGSTGPVIIFMGILYTACGALGIPYLPTLSWVGLWTMAILLVLAFTDASSLIRYFTRFTDDTFAALISVIFIYEAVKDMLHGFDVTSHGLEESAHVPYDTALLSLLLSLGTFYLSMVLVRARTGPYLRRQIREFFADFGPTIAIVLMTGLALWLHPVQLETLAVPDTFAPTADRAWLVDPFEAPQWVWGASIIPAILVSMLLYLDQNITVRLVNNNEFKLKKGAGYHLDLAIVGVLVGLCSLFGLPWMVAATVRSLNHVRSLNVLERQEGKEVVVGTVETRVTGLFVHLAVGASLLALPLLQRVPMSVLFGLFLYMGVASMRGNQLFERLELFIMDPARYPPAHYLRAVPTGVVRRFTLIQAACLAVLWFVKTSAVGILFPLFIALLVPIRMLLDRFFEPEHLALLDAEEEPEQEAFRESV